jgi:para-aminobenzoate synthetase component 1
MKQPSYPLAKQIDYLESQHVFEHFADQPWAIFLDSAQQGHTGRYSFIASDPFLTIQSKNGKVETNNKQFTADPFEILKEQLNHFFLQTIPGLPPFQGGAVGYFSYELNQHIEKVPTNSDDMNFPDLVFGLYDVVLAFDQQEKKSWIFSSGFPETDEQKRIKRAEERITWLLNQIRHKKPIIPPNPPLQEKELIKSNFNKTEYEQAVTKALQYIYAGDIYQVNLSQRFTAKLPENLSSIQLYNRLRQINPAPFAAFLNYGDVVIASASPERFLKTQNNIVETRPIKGTRKRSNIIQQDRVLAEQLLQSEKDRAENVMIVDLLRNDLGRVCENVTVPILCELESYATVHHLVSVVTGKLLGHYDVVDLIKACFPGGSITGAPKIRSMEIIAELEPTARGPYCGSVAYIGFDGSMDSSIIIRTYAIKNNIVTFQAGGGIVADSDPEKEYEETLIKAQALCSALIQ